MRDEGFRSKLIANTWQESNDARKASITMPRNRTMTANPHAAEFTNGTLPKPPFLNLRALKKETCGVYLHYAKDGKEQVIGSCIYYHRGGAESYRP